MVRKGPDWMSQFWLDKACFALFRDVFLFGVYTKTFLAGGHFTKYTDSPPCPWQHAILMLHGSHTWQRGSRPSAVKGPVAGTIRAE